MKPDSENEIRKCINLILEVQSPMPIRQKMNISVPNDIKDIHRHMKKRGKKLYIVGGAIRDELMGKSPKDYDLSTDATPDEVINILQYYVRQISKIGDQFPVVMARTHDGNDYEIATFRKDERVHKDSDDKKVVIKNVTVDQDVLRRDLTINALVYDIDTGEIVDYVGGIDDIQKGVVRAVGNPVDRFYEDKSRILRAVRFAARLGSEIDGETSAAIINDEGLRNGDIGAIRAEERITEEFKKGIATSQDPAVYIKMLNDLGLLEQIFPDMMVDFSPSSSRDVAIQLAHILKKNDINKVKDILSYIRHSNETTSVTLFLLGFLTMDRDSAPDFKKQFKRIRMNPDSLREFMLISDSPNKNIVEGFLSFVESPPAADPRELISQGLKGPEIGAAMARAESDAYFQIISNLSESIRSLCEQAIDESIDHDLVEFIVKSNEIEGYHVDPEDVIDALSGINQGYPLSYVSTNPHIISHLSGLGVVNERDPSKISTAIAVHSSMGPDVIDSGAPGIIRSGVEAKASGGRDYVLSQYIPEAMSWWENKTFSSPFERHVAYEIIHPFADGNGRSGRILLVADMGFNFKEANKIISDRETYFSALREIGQKYSGDFWNESEQLEDKVRESIRNIILNESLDEEPDLLHFSDTLNNMISSMIFRQELISHLNKSVADTEMTTILDTGELFKNYDTVNEVHLGIIINDEGSGKISAYYNCVVSDRSKSNLTIVLDIPRNYETIDDFKRWLSIELEGVLSHELQHSCDPTEMLDDDIPEGEEKWASPENILKHFGSQAETRGNVAEIIGRARISGEDTSDILDDYVNSIVEDGWRRGFEEEEMIPVAQEIWRRWDARLQELTPESTISEGTVQLPLAFTLWKEFGEAMMSSYSYAKGLASQYYDDRAKADAFRHIYASALFTLQVGGTATRVLGQFNELAGAIKSLAKGGDFDSEWVKDTANNEIGIDTGRRAASRDDAERMAREAVDSGNFYIDDNTLFKDAQVNETKKKKKKKKKSKKYVEKTYQLGTSKSLDLNKPTSHGGWPDGPSKSYTSNKPVNKQISDWLKGMSMISETPSYFGGGFANFKQLVDSGIDAIEAAKESGFKRIGKGYSRMVYEHPTSKDLVLKIAHGMGNAESGDEGDIDLARRTNIAEGSSGKNNLFNVFPKVYPGDPAGNWILSEKVNTLNSIQDMDEFFPEANISKAKYMWILFLDMGAKYSKEMGDIHSSGNWTAEPVEFKKQIEQLSTTVPGRQVAERFLELWKNPLFREVSKAMSYFNISPQEMRYDNVGFVMRDGKKQFVILDVSVGLEGTGSQIDSDETFVA